MVKLQIYKILQCTVCAISHFLKKFWTISFPNKSSDYFALPTAYFVDFLQ